MTQEQSIDEILDNIEPDISRLGSMSDAYEIAKTKLLAMLNEARVELADYIDKLINMGYRTDTATGTYRFKQAIRDRLAQLNKEKKR
jgi:hypothetical protein